MLAASAIQNAGAGGAGSEGDVFYSLTAEGISQLAGRLTHATMPPSQRWAAYIATNDATSVARAGQVALGEDEVAVIPASLKADMAAPEVAFYVDASGSDTAVAAASQLYAGLRELAGLRPEPAHITTLLPPEARSRTRKG